MALFKDRYDAGVQLASALEQYGNRSDVVLMAIPRGGVSVAYRMAQILALPLDVLIVRKLGYPEHKELAMGAIATGGVTILNREVIQTVSNDELNAVITEESRELMRSEELYRGHRHYDSLISRTAILVDDGLTTDSLMRAAVSALRNLKPDRLVIAVPLATRDVFVQLSDLADEIICPHVPSSFLSVGRWYEDSVPTTDGEVIQILKECTVEISYHNSLRHA